MPIRKPTVKIVNDKIVFSNSVLDYFKSIKTEENSEWIDKYFKILFDVSNAYSKKYNIHHIRPCFTFKDKNHKSRKETEPLADKFDENKIKLSIYNHFFAHYYLWKIFNTRDSKEVFQRMCGQEKYIVNLTENELKEVARLKEDCTKENVTEEQLIKSKRKYAETHKEEAKTYREFHKQEKAEYDKNYRKNNKDKILKQTLEWMKTNKEKVKIIRTRYEDNHKQEISDRKRNYYQQNKEKILNRNRNYNNQLCHDPIKENNCTLTALQTRKKYNKDLYKDVIPSNCIIK